MGYTVIEYRRCPICLIHLFLFDLSKICCQKNCLICFSLSKLIRSRIWSLLSLSWISPFTNMFSNTALSVAYVILSWSKLARPTAESRCIAASTAISVLSLIMVNWLITLINLSRNGINWSMTPLQDILWRQVLIISASARKPHFACVISFLYFLEQMSFPLRISETNWDRWKILQ